MVQFYHMTDADFDQKEFTKLALVTFGAILILIGATYSAYRYSQNRIGNIILPGGVTYLGPSPKDEKPVNITSPTPSQKGFSADSNVSWKTQAGKKYQFSFSYPETLPLAVFQNDPDDTIAIVWEKIPAQENILVNVENLQKTEKEKFIKNWYTNSAQLTSFVNVQPFNTVNGLKGYKAIYKNKNGSQEIHVFFENSKNLQILLHFHQTILPADIFSRLLDSVKWK